MISELLSAVDHGNLAALTLLDLSAAFDTVDHDGVPTLNHPTVITRQLNTQTFHHATVNH